MDYIEQEKKTVTEHRRIELLFQQSFGATLTSIVSVIIATVIFYIETENFSYFIWAGIVVFFNLSRIFLGSRFFKTTPPVKKYYRWSQYYFISSALSGISWGSLLAIDFSTLAPPYQLLSLVIVLFVGFVGISTYSTVLLAFLIFMSSLYSTSIVLILLFQQADYYSLTLLFIITYPIFVSTASNFNKNIIDSMSKQFQVERLLQQVENSNELLEEKVISRTIDLVQAKESAESATKASSEFLANMTHELRTPLHAILSFSKLGARRKENYSTSKMLEYFDKIHQSGDRLLQLMENLLELSKFDAGKVTFHIINTSFSNIILDSLNNIEALTHEKSIRIETLLPETDLEVMLDKVRMEQVINNLLANAVKFSPVNGEIVIKVEQHDMVTGRRDTDTKTRPAIKVTVSDEGIGIPDNELDMIFDKFSQSSKTKTGAGGTGLGLAICKEVISGHGGKIWAENNASKGASFLFIIPLKDDNN